MRRAQATVTGAIRGVVTDASGGVLPNVAIVAEGPAIMTPRKTTTDVAGNYLFDSLPTGTYQLTYTISGYKSEVRSSITITPGFTATVSPQLSVGVSQQSVVVQAAPWLSTPRITQPPPPSMMHCCRTYRVDATRFPRWPRHPASHQATSILQEASASSNR